MHPLVTLALLLPVASPQSADRAVSPPSVDQVVEAWETQDPAMPLLQEEHGDDLPNRIDPAWYQEIPIPGPEARLRPGGTRTALVFDPATGLETTVPIGHDVFGSRFETGYLPRGLTSERESYAKSFGTLTSVTSKAYPWSTQCKVFVTLNGSNYIASGTLIDAYHIITAGHVIHGGPGGTWATNVWVAPAWDGDSNAFGIGNATAMMTFTDWASNGSSLGDMAFIRLDRPVGYLSGWLGSFYNSNSSFWGLEIFRFAGFPGACFAGAPNRLYTSGGSLDKIWSQTVEAHLSSSCWIGGMSGSGLYYGDENGNRFVGGDVSHAWKTSQGGTSRFGATRMTSSKFTSFHSTFKPGAYPSTQVDYVPLKVRTSPSTIKQGTKPSTFSYLVYNAATFNPPTGTVNVHVYLSKDKNISTGDMKIQSHSVSWNFGPGTGVTVHAPPPTIPFSTVPGTYYVGIIVTNADAKTSNNDTDNWDAMKIAVTL